MFAVSPITLCGFTLNVQTICDNHVITAVISNPIFILLVFLLAVTKYILFLTLLEVSRKPCTSSLASMILFSSVQLWSRFY